jgi:hypothetical protein
VKLTAGGAVSGPHLTKLNSLVGSVPVETG